MRESHRWHRQCIARDVGQNYIHGDFKKTLAPPMYVLRLDARTVIKRDTFGLALRRMIIFITL
jgi:hypothetical protein